MDYIIKLFGCCTDRVNDSDISDPNGSTHTKSSKPINEE